MEINLNLSKYQFLIPILNKYIKDNKLAVEKNPFSHLDKTDFKNGQAVILTMSKDDIDFIEQALAREAYQINEKYDSIRNKVAAIDIVAKEFLQFSNQLLNFSLSYLISDDLR